MNSDEKKFCSLVSLLSACPDNLQEWIDSSLQAIRLAKTSMAAFVEKYGDGDGVENPVGAYWTLDMGDDLAKLNMPLLSGKFWHYVAFAQLLDCEEEKLVVAGDDSETVWLEIVDSFEDSAMLELDSAVFSEDPEQYLKMMQEKLDLYAGDKVPYRLLSLRPPLPDGAEIYAALVKSDVVKTAIELFSHFGVKTVEVAGRAHW